MEDSKIIELFFERSQSAIKELSEKYGKMCNKVALNILGNSLDANECVNDVYLGVWNAIPPESPKSLAGYVCRVTRNLAVKMYRKNTALKRNTFYDVSLDELTECFSCADSVHEEYSAKEAAKEIDSFLLSCKAQDRIMFVRRYFFSDSLSDIGELFGVNEHYVSVRLSRTKAKLKNHLTEKGISI